MELLRIIFAFISFFSAFLSPHLFSTILVVGDSHSREFKGIEECQIHWVGPVTMHRIGRDGLDGFDLSSQLQEAEAVVLVFGEIDVRCHIGKQVDRAQRSCEEAIDTLARNYIRTILKNRERYQNLWIVYSVTPPIDHPSTPEFPFYGSLQQRAEYAELLNAKLDELCWLENIPFLDTYNFYALEDDTLDPSMSDGNVHINHIYNQPIREALDAILYYYHSMQEAIEAKGIK